MNKLAEEASFDAVEVLEEVEAQPRRWKAHRDQKRTDIPWLRDVPAHWVVRRLKTSLISNDGGVWGEDFDPNGTLVLRSTEQTVDGGWSIDNPARRSLTAKERADALHLVVTKSSGSESHIGKTSIVTKEVAQLGCCFSNFMQRLRTDDKTDPRFVYWILNSPIGREQFAYGSNSTVGLANLNGSTIGNIRCAFPPLPEQRAIVAFLRRETARIDALVENKRRLIDPLKEKRSALISHAVTKGLNSNTPTKPSGVEWIGDIPAHWQVPPMYARYIVELGKMLDEKQMTRSHLVPYLRNVDVQWDSINIDDLPQMDIEERQYERFTLKPGDLVVCEGGEVGRCAFWKGQLDLCGYQKALHRLRPRCPGRDNPRFLFYVMWTAAHGGVFVAGGNPNTIPHLTGDKLRVYRFAFSASR